MTYTPRTFALPELTGISKKQIEVHLKLYEGYVTHANILVERMKSLAEDGTEESAFIMRELRRRFSFEFNGMRMHDYYFEQFEGGSQPVDENSPLADAAKNSFGDWEKFIAAIKDTAGTRGVGWVIVYFDPKNRALQVAWVNEHELGQLAALPILIAFDLWEHAFMVDYVPAQKNLYVDACFQNLNWGIVERRFLNEAV